VRKYIYVVLSHPLCGNLLCQPKEINIIIFKKKNLGNVTLGVLGLLRKDCDELINTFPLP
jgi:hypothetical protein